MKEELTNKKGSILAPALIGSAVGAGLALLFAPQSGTETRKDLKRAADRITQTIDISKDLYGEGRVFVSKAVEAGKKAYIEEKPVERVMTGTSSLSLIVPVLASGIIGAGIALLLAPKTGRETRKDLKRVASNTGEWIASTIDRGIDKGKDFYAAGKDAMAAAVEAGKEKFERAA